MMDRSRMIDHLKTMIESEIRQARMKRPFLDKRAARTMEQQHWNNAAALQAAVAELEDFRPVARVPDPCPEPTREGDEYKCIKCLHRWDVSEEKPPCYNVGR